MSSFFFPSAIQVCSQIVQRFFRNIQTYCLPCCRSAFILLLKWPLKRLWKILVVRIPARCVLDAICLPIPAADSHKATLPDAGHLKEPWTLEKQLAHILPSWQPFDGLTRVLLQVGIACLGAYLFGYHLS